LSLYPQPQARHRRGASSAQLVQEKSARNSSDQ